MSDGAHRMRMLRGMALLCLALLVCTISLSAYMRLAQSGLGCAEWPACYGRVVDAAPTAVALARLAHRAVATLALILIVTMVLACLFTQPRLAREGALAGALLAVALALAVLGVYTPGARVPAVALGNLLGGFVMLALCWRLAAIAGAAGAPNGLGAWGVAGLALLLAQLFTGALVSAAFAATACTDLSACLRDVRASGFDAGAFDVLRIPRAEADGAAKSLHLFHRLGAFIVAPALMGLGWLARRRGQGGPGMALIALPALQVIVGAAMVGAGLPLGVVLLHNLLAALTLAVLVRLI